MKTKKDASENNLSEDISRAKLSEEKLRLHSHPKFPI
jgi:hypothetical protein